MFGGERAQRDQSQPRSPTCSTFAQGVDRRVLGGVRAAHSIANDHSAPGVCSDPGRSHIGRPSRGGGGRPLRARSAWRPLRPGVARRVIAMPVREHHPAQRLAGRLGDGLITGASAGSSRASPPRRHRPGRPKTSCPPRREEVRRQRVDLALLERDSHRGTPRAERRWRPTKRRERGAAFPPDLPVRSCCRAGARFLPARWLPLVWRISR